MKTNTQARGADDQQLVEALREYADETGVLGEAAERLERYAAAAADRDEEDAQRSKRLDDLSDRLSDMLEKLGDFSAELQREIDT
jgi:ABC-type transporter Mla subunit MlaD